MSSKAKKERKGRQKADRFFMVPYKMYDSQAYQSLSPNARAVHLELKYRFNGRNNGQIPLSIREGRQRLHMAQTTLRNALSELVEKGFIRLNTEAAISHRGNRAREWILTEFEHDGKPPTMDYIDWRPPSKKQKGVSECDTQCVKMRYAVDDSPRNEPPCVPECDTQTPDSAPVCVPECDTLSIYSHADSQKEPPPSHIEHPSLPSNNNQSCDDVESASPHEIGIESELPKNRGCGQPVENHRIKSAAFEQLDELLAAYNAQADAAPMFQPVLNRERRPAVSVPGCHKPFTRQSIPHLRETYELSGTSRLANAVAEQLGIEPTDDVFEWAIGKVESAFVLEAVA